MDWIPIFCYSKIIIWPTLYDYANCSSSGELGFVFKLEFILDFSTQDLENFLLGMHLLIHYAQGNSWCKESHISFIHLPQDLRVRGVIVCVSYSTISKMHCNGYKNGGCRPYGLPSCFNYRLSFVQHVEVVDLMVDPLASIVGFHP